jgi:hypothetical protein
LAFSLRIANISSGCSYCHFNISAARDYPNSGCYFIHSKAFGKAFGEIFEPPEVILYPNCGSLALYNYIYSFSLLFNSS